MPLIIVLLRLSLSAIFAVAGVTKLLDQRGTRDALKNFGLPESLAPALSIVLPLVELAIAAGLLFAGTAGASALAALLLLGLFVLAISVNLARGRTHDCHCFGQLYSRPLGWPTVARNLVFALGAGTLLWQTRTQPGANVLNLLAQLNAFQWLLLVGVIVVVLLILVYLQRRRKSLPAKPSTAPQGLPLDSIAPPFEVAAYFGGKISLAELLSYGKPVLLVFTNPNCGPCVAIFKEIKEWQESHSEQLTIALLSFGTIKQNFVNVARNGLGQLLLQQKREVAEKYRANVTPTAVVVSTSGRIASPLAAGADEIRKLLATVLENSFNLDPEHRSSQAL
jgi:thiol-disulfide isomerase/thioredoxin